ncbi:hypothetical protein OROHE_019437 [Orobanche hederae]
MKSELYFVGVSDVRKVEIMADVQIREGSLPFRYLGIPLNAKRLSVVHSQPLLEKMVAKVRHCTARFLTYEGRVQLEQSVLYSVQNYWSQIFVFPKKVMKAIESICRQFLWSRDVGNYRRALVGWDEVCQSRACGGLNLVHLPTWNKACIFKLLGALHNKEDKLWIRWIHAYYIKDAQFMTMEVHGSFLMKKLLKLRTVINLSAGGMQILNTSSFSQKVAYLVLRPAGDKVEWKELVLNNMATPRAHFILWLALKRRLASKDRLIRFNINVDPLCAYCGTVNETISHLLFGCTGIKEVWKSILVWMNVPRAVGDWSVEAIDASRMSRGKHVKSRFLKVVFTELVYAVWKERNARIFQTACTDFSLILRRVVQTVICGCSFDPKIRAFCEALNSYPSV